MNAIAIFSVPRSGSSWLGQIFNSSPEVAYRFQPNFSYSFPETLPYQSDSAQIESFYNKLLLTEDPFVNAKNKMGGGGNLEFHKSDLNYLVWKEVHYLYLMESLLKNSDTKVIGLVRSPFAVISSWLKAPVEFHPTWDIGAQWKTGDKKNNNSEHYFFGYNKWKEISQLFLKLKKDYPDTFYILNYDDLLKDAHDAVERMFSFCGLQLSDQTSNFLSKSTETNESDAYSVFKTKHRDDSWKKNLPQFIVDDINQDSEFENLNKIFKWV